MKLKNWMRTIQKQKIKQELPTHKAMKNSKNITSISNAGKLTTTSASLVTRDMAEIAQKTGNVYESVFIIAQRAKQIAVKTKEELTNKLNDFSSPVDNLEEIFENREQIEISKFYERMPKPTSVATEEFIEDKLTWKYIDESQGE
jgi:DNA-directed RNA polymerase subunit K/omega